jgi:hypothetical protein
MATTPTTPETRVKTIEEREFDLKAAQFKREQDALPHTLEDFMRLDSLLAQNLDKNEIEWRLV